MKKVALTGGIGSGKSLVGSMLKEMGFAVIDMDSIVSALYRERQVRERLVVLFGSLDRQEIARQAFAQPSKRKALESLLHPRALIELERKLSSLQGREAVFVEVPLLFEAGLEREFDVVVVVFAPEEKRLRRLVKRGMNRADALKRMGCQLSDEEKVKKAGFAIDNGGSIKETRKQVELMIKGLLNETKLRVSN